MSAPATPTSLMMDAPDPDLKRSDISNFAGRLPDPGEIVRWTGLPGVQYLMIDSRNLQEARSLPPVKRESGKSFSWVTSRDSNIYTVTGPLGVTTLMILARGEPIKGADPANGIREWFYDRTLLSTTGLKAPYNAIPLPKEKETP